MKNVTMYSAKSRFVALLDGVTGALVASGVTAQTVTLAALPLAALITVALLAGTFNPVFWLFVPVGGTLLMAANAIDGDLARRTGTTTTRGAVLNELVDRIADVTVLGSACLIAPEAPAATALILVLIAEIVALIGWGALGTRALVGVMGKPDRMLTISVTSVLAVFFGSRAFTAAAVVIGIGASITTAQRTIWVVRRAG